MQRVDLLEKTLTLAKIEGRRRRGRQRRRWLDSIIESMDMHLSKLWEMVEHRGAWPATVHGVTKSRTWLSGWTAAGPWALCHVTWSARLHLARPLPASPAHATPVLTLQVSLMPQLLQVFWKDHHMWYFFWLEYFSPHHTISTSPLNPNISLTQDSFPWPCSPTHPHCHTQTWSKLCFMLWTQGLFQWVDSLPQGTGASILPVNIQGWFLLKWTGLISLQSRVLQMLTNVEWALCYEHGLSCALCCELIVLSVIAWNRNSDQQWQGSSCSSHWCGPVLTGTGQTKCMSVPRQARSFFYPSTKDDSDMAGSFSSPLLTRILWCGILRQMVGSRRKWREILQEILGGAVEYEENEELLS